MLGTTRPRRRPGRGSGYRAAPVGFFERNRRRVAERGYDPARLPPGQYLTERFPVLSVEDGVPVVDLETWELVLTGRVREERRVGWAELRALPATEFVCDIHCVTKWSKFDTRWEGVRFRDLMALAEVDPAATHLLQHSVTGYTTNLPLDALLGDGAVVAWSYDGAPIPPEHGGPVRLVAPARYFWKSAKWLHALEFLAGDAPGFWERNGYHNEGDPWREQRYWGD